MVDCAGARQCRRRHPLFGRLCPVSVLPLSAAGLLSVLSAAGASLLAGPQLYTAINIGLNAGQTPPANVPVAGNNAFANAAPANAAAILGSLTTRSCDIDFWPNVDYLATKSPTSQKIIVNVDLNNDNVWLLDKATATVFGALGVCGIVPCPGHNAGHFAYSHTTAVDSKGNIYLAETITGRRLQKFVQMK